jgi:hypothetical protein
MVDATALGSNKQIFNRAFATTIQPILVLEETLGPFGYMGMEDMGMDINEHSAPDSFSAPYSSYHGSGNDAC